MPKKGSKGNLEALEGLAESWNRNRGIREHLLRAGSLLAWPKPKLCGVVSFHTASFTFGVLSRVLRIHLPKLEKLRTINVDATRHEVRGFVLTACAFLNTQKHPRKIRNPFQATKLRRALSMPEDLVMVSCDAQSIRCFVSYLIKRHDGSSRHVSRQEWDSWRNSFSKSLMGFTCKGLQHREAV